MSNLVGVHTQVRTSPFGIIIRISYEKKILYSKDIEFDLYLEGKYPFQPPRLLCESVFAFPSVSDGRDLLPEILKQKWTPSITSTDIINLIPGFFINDLLPNQAELQNRDFGKFHLGSPYSLEIWERKESMRSFYSIENDIKNPKYTKERIIVVTHTVILLLELNERHPGMGYLISWATLQSLNVIKRSRSEPERITFEWRKIEENPPYSQQFTILKASEVIDLINRNIQKIGAGNKNQGNNSVYNEEEVTGKSIKKMNINEILQAIEVYEDNLENKMSVNIINSLMELYQQAIEYFAAIGNPQHEMFLRRMHMLLADENILAVLQGKSQPQNISEKSVISQIIEEKKNDEHQIHESEIISEKVENSTVEKQESTRLRIEKE